MRATLSHHRRADTPPQESFPSNLDVAWRIHAAQESWISRADTKASILLGVIAIVLGATLTARAQTDGLLAGVGGWRADLLRAALVMCALGALLAAAATVPMLGPARRRAPVHGTIYFGDLRHRRPDELARQLAGMTDDEQIAQVSRQLVVIAKASWLKHRIMQVALGAALLGFTQIVVVMAS